MNVLFEILTEELPAKELSNVNKDILDKILQKYNIAYESLSLYFTPRRIAVELNCHPFTINTQNKIIGPPKKTCFDESNKPTRALMGFLEKNNCGLNDIFFEETKKGTYVCIYAKCISVDVSTLLCAVFKEFLNSIPFKKQMRWGDGEYSFLRPVHNVVLLGDGKTIDCSMFGKKSTSHTFGHRFLSSGKVELYSANYKEALRKHFVIVDQEERKVLIREGLEKLSDENKHYFCDAELLSEVVNLVEYPHCLEGTFEEDFLKLPQEVLISSMKTNQKYFYSLDNNGKLLNKFCVVSNILTDNDINITKGNARVLRARFRDANFFYEEDLKIKLEDLAEKLKTMLFHKDLGSMYMRVMRIVDLAEHLAKVIGTDPEKAKQAAYLSKSDLLTHMVYEFPELQGVMGMYYAKSQGFDQTVSISLFEQYLPKDDNYPKTKEGLTLSLSDKIDLIAGGMIANLKPTGNKDPYALRRAALGIIKLVLKNNLHLNIRELFSFALSLYEKQDMIFKKEEILHEIIEFIKLRFINTFEEQIEIVNAVVETDFHDIYDSYLKIEALKVFLKKSSIDELFSIKRVFNIVPDAFIDTRVDVGLLSVEQEVKFFEFLNSNLKESNAFLANEDYSSYLNSIAGVETITDFFDKVLIIDNNEEIKRNRLALLNRYKQMVLKIANFKFLSI